ncbi:MAG: histidine triad nucleotide-binding protein [Methylomonas sp.]
MNTDDCLFCKMATGVIQTNVVFEDDKLLAFHDITPQAPLHVLIIPKQHITNLNDLDDSELGGRLLQTAARLAAKFGYADSGYRLVFNTNADGGQSVYHLHAHLLSGRKLRWPPG